MPPKRKRQKVKHWNSDLQAEELIKDTTEREKLHVLEISRRIGRYLSGFLIATGTISTFLATQFFFSAESLFTPELKSLFLLILGFIGIVNLISGLVLLAKE